MYVTFKKNPRFVQMTLDDLWFGDDNDFENDYQDVTCTVTYKMDEPNQRLMSMINVNSMIDALNKFNEKYANLFDADRYSLYSIFYCEKRGKGMRNVFNGVFRSQPHYVQCDSKEVCSHIASLLRPLLVQHSAMVHLSTYGQCKRAVLDYLADNGFVTSVIDWDALIKSSFRKISAPDYKLKDALTELKRLFENDFCQNIPDQSGRVYPDRKFYHTSAFAYIRGRGIVPDLRRHQANKSRWFGKFDLADFFGSTTPQYVMEMFARIFPFSEIIKAGGGKPLHKALELAFLDGGLPQGTPISPLITNIIMIPVDFELSKMFRTGAMSENPDRPNQRFVYTRYADDFLVSSRFDFNVKSIERKIVDVLASFNAPFTIKAEKTRYGSSSGRNWNLGLMLNKDNQITVGHKKKREFRAELSSYVMDRKNGIRWSLNDVQVMEGTRSYYSMVEPDAIAGIIGKVNTKFGVDVMQMIKKDLRELA